MRLQKKMDNWCGRLRDACIQAYRRFLPPEERDNESITLEVMKTTVPEGVVMMSKQLLSGSRLFRPFKKAKTFVEDYMTPDMPGIYQVIMGSQKRKVYFDFECETEKYKELFDCGEYEYAPAVNALLSAFFKFLDDVIALPHPTRYSKSVVEIGTRPGKVSFHVLCQRLHWPNGEEAKACIDTFCGWLQDYTGLSEGKKEVLFDKAPYGRTSQNVRLLGAYKTGKPESKLRRTRGGFPSKEVYLSDHILTTIDTNSAELSGFIPEHTVRPRRVVTAPRISHTLHLSQCQLFSLCGFMRLTPADIVITSRAAPGSFIHFAVNLSASAIRRKLRFPCPNQEGNYHITNGAHIFIDNSQKLWIKCWKPECPPRVPSVKKLVWAPEREREVPIENIDSRYIGDVPLIYNRIRQACYGGDEVNIGIHSPPGTGKTTLLSSLLQSTEEEDYCRILVIVPRRSLAKDVARRLNMPCYLDNDGAVRRRRFEKSLVVCAPSLRKIDMGQITPDGLGNPPPPLIIVIDELRTLIDLLVSPVMPGPSVTKFLSILPVAKSMVCLEAFWDSACDVFLSAAGGGKECIVYKNLHPPPFNRKLIEYRQLGDFERRFKEIVSDVRHKVFVCCKSVSNASVMAGLAREVGVSPKVYSTGHEKAPEDVESAWETERCVIVTSIMGVGVDYSLGTPFTHTFLIALEGDGPSAKDFIQMVMRTRRSTSREIHAYFPTKRKRQVVEEEARASVYRDGYDFAIQRLRERIDGGDGLVVLEVEREMMLNLYSLVKISNEKSIEDLKQALLEVAGDHFMATEYVAGEGESATRKETDFYRIQKELDDSNRVREVPSRWKHLKFIESNAREREQIDFRAIGKHEAVKEAAAISFLLSFCSPRLSFYSLENAARAETDSLIVELPETGVHVSEGVRDSLQALQPEKEAPAVGGQISLRGLKRFLTTALNRLGIKKKTWSWRQKHKIKVSNIVNAYKVYINAEEGRSSELDFVLVPDFSLTESTSSTTYTSGEDLGTSGSNLLAGFDAHTPYTSHGEEDSHRHPNPLPDFELSQQDLLSLDYLDPL